MAYATDGKIGIDLTAIYASASASSMNQLPWTPGTRVTTSENGTAIFCRAESTVAAGDCVIFSSYGDSAGTGPVPRAVPITTTNAAALGWGMVGFAQTAITSAYYGWVHLNGNNVIVSLAASCQPKVPLYTTGNAGILDDATVSAGYIVGLVAHTSGSGGGATLVRCFANHTVTLGHA